jgi:hypothetical protein
MTNRVSIQYSIDLEELPDELNRICSKAKQLLVNTSIPDKSGPELLTSEGLKQIDQTRKNLVALDHILSDVSGIIRSYVDFEMSHLDPPSEGEPDVEDSVEVSV